jgi:ceramide glucosyltransferase
VTGHGPVLHCALYAVAAVAMAYQVIALIATLRHRFARVPRASRRPGISILKPVRGLDPGFYDAIRSHAIQEYPEFEILFGVHDPADPAVGEIRRLIDEFPRVTIRLIESASVAPNGKVGVLMDLALQARYPLWIVNDSDITVPAGYLRDVVAPLEDSNVGLVTCLYRAESDGWPGRWEALGIATDFAPSALVAPLFGVSEFGLGSTLVFRREDLDRIGGFEALRDYLADDYQLGAMLHSQGRKNVISKVVVSTRLGGQSWSAVWAHQVRWARTIRLSKPWGYAGLPVTFASLWALAAASAGLWSITAALLTVRLAVAIAAGWVVLGSRDAVRLAPLIPGRDLYTVAVWLAALFGRTVHWRGLELVLDRSGRIVEQVDKPKAD